VDHTKTGTRHKAVRLKKARKHTASSQRWLERQLNDPYVHEAKRRGYRSRAAFKLIELNEKYKFLKRHARVVDLGAAPGGWTQVVLENLDLKDPKNLVVALDLLAIDPALPPAICLQMDFMDEAAPAKVKELLDGPADMVLSDMSPSTTGHTATDHLRIVTLVELALEFAEQVLAPGGVFVAKVFQGGTEKTLLDRLKKNFTKVYHAKPKASRKESAEMYVVALGFRGKN
jgi:23S rRNA (uridine2552-2'-O)-methyltransferase